MKPIILTLVFSLVFLNCFSAFAGESTIVYIQAQTTQLKSEPKSAAIVLAALKRGDEIAVLKADGQWLQVKTAKNIEGWVPKILTSSVKPLGQAQLLKDTANLDSNAKTSRRRTSDYAVSAATRGLSAGERRRPGDESFRSNRKAVDELEKIQITPEQTKKFKEEGQLKD